MNSPYIRARKHARLLQDSRLATAAIASLAAATAPAFAQSSATLQEVRVDGTADNRVPDAQSPKYTAPLIDTAKSVTIIPEEVIRQTGSVSLTEALRTTPGITFGAGEGGNPSGDRPFLRGYDTQSSTYVDGLRDIAPSTREVFNIENIEVVKGADSTMGGRGGAGGSINLTTKAPRLENFSNGSIGLGSDDYRRATVDMNRTFGDSGAFRLNAMKYEADIPGRNGPNYDRWGIAPSVSWGLGTPDRFTLSYFHMESDDMPDSGIPYNLPSTFPSSGTVSLTPNTGGNRNNWYGLNSRDYRREKDDSLTAIVEHDISGTLKLRNITRATHSVLDYIVTQPDDSQGNVARGLVWRRANASYRVTKTIANGTDLKGQGNWGGYKHSFDLGLELSHEESSTDSYTNNLAAYSANQKCPNGAGAASSYVCTSLSNPNPDDPYTGTFTRANNPATYRTNTISLYSFDTIDLSDKWKLNAGLRYDRYDTAQTAAIATGATSGLHYGLVSNLVNGQLGVVYKPASNGSIYASVSTSATPGGSSLGQGSETQALSGTVNGVANSALDLKPEKNLSYEVGTKWDLLDNMLSLTGALFRIETTNARITNADGSTSMAGDKIVNGGEIGFSGRITRAWNVFGGYTLLDSKGENMGQTNIGTTAAPVYINNAATGRQFVNTPKNGASLWTTYKVLPGLTVGGGVFAQSRVFGGYAYASGTNGRTLLERSVNGYTRLDLMASYVVNKHVTLQLNIQNATNKLYYTAAYATHYAMIAPGRSGSLTASFSY